MIYRISLLLILVAIFTACKKKKPDAPQPREKNEPVLVLDTIIQTAFNAFQVKGSISQPWWLTQSERGILYSTDPEPVLGNSTLLPLSSSKEVLKLQYDIGDLSDGKDYFIRLYIKTVDNAVWHSRSKKVTTQTIQLLTLEYNKLAGGMTAAIRTWPSFWELYDKQIQIYVGPYKAEVDYQEGQPNWMRFKLPENMAPGKYPVIGKLNNFTVLAVDSVEILIGKWRMLPAAPFKGRGRMAHFVWNNKGFIVGGTPAAQYDGIYREVWQLDLNSRTWTRKNDFPINIQDAIAFNINNRIFVMSGVTSNPDPNEIYMRKIFQHDIWEYHPANDTWTNRGPHPQQKLGRSLMTGTVFNNRIYIGTGSYFLKNFFNGPITFSDWMSYEPSTNTWTELASVYSIGFRGGSCFHDGKYIYILGGDNLTSDALTELRRYDVQTNTWDVVSDNMPYEYRRTEGGVAYIRGVPYVFAGLRAVSGNPYWVNSTDLWRFNSDTHDWTRHLYFNATSGIVITPGNQDNPSLIFPGAQPAIFSTSKGFIVFGGSYHIEGSGYSSTFAEYTLE